MRPIRLIRPIRHMKYLANNKFFSRYLPMFLSVLLIVVGALTYFSFNSPQVTQASWYSNSWSYRKQIIINHTKVNTATGTTTPLSNFPMLFSVTDSDLKYTGFGGKVGKADGTDILFTQSDGSTKLNHEIESYSSSTGATVIWVSIPTVSSTADTAIYIYFGNAAAADQQAVTSVWDTNYKAVWHLGNSNGISLNDSTSNANNGINNGATTGAGIINNAANFSSSNWATVSPASSLNLTNNFTMETWVKLNASQSAKFIFMKIYGVPNLDYSLIYGWSGPVYQFYSEYYSGANPSNSTIPVNVTDTNFHQIIWTYDSVTLKGYLDGQLKASYTLSFSLNADNVPFYFNHPTNGGQRTNMVMDETRLSNIARSQDWIATQFINQATPFAFYTYSTAQVQNPVSAGNSFVNKGSPKIKIRGHVLFR